MPKSKKSILILIAVSIIIIASIIISFLIYRNHKLNQLNIDMSFVTEVENITPPTFPNNTCNIIDYGASNNLESVIKSAWIDLNSETLKSANEIDKNNNFKAFEDAIEDCANKGGGIVKVPAGEWRVGGPIHLKSNINLYLEENATISFSTNPDDFLPTVKTRYTGLELYNYSPMIYASDCENIAITGKGVIQGTSEFETNGWEKFIKNKRKAEKRLYKMANDNASIEERIFGTVEDALRPSLIQPYNCNNILIEDVTIKEGPMWTLHVLYTNNLIIRNINIETDGPNTDGIVIDSSTNVLIENNNLATGDDAIAIKSGKDRDGWRVGKPSQNIVIKNNQITDAHAGLAIGSEMSGDVRNIFVDNLNVQKADRGIRIKSRIGRGGIIENILVQNSLIKNTKREPIQINLDYGSKFTKPKTTKKPLLKNIQFSNIEIDNGNEIAIEIIGLKNKLTSILFENINIKNQNKIINIDTTKYLKFKNVNASIYEIKNSKNIEIKNNPCPKINQENSKNIKIECE